MHALPSVPLRGWADPAALFAGHEAGAAHAFWLDAGSGALDGWSYLGSGAPVDAVVVRSVRLGTDPVERSQGAGPFRGGFVGVEGYEDAAARFGAPVAQTPEPSSLWLRADRFLAFDHANRVVHAVAPPDELQEYGARAQRRIDDAAEDARPRPAEPHVALSRHLPDAYAALVERCRDAIRAGDAYQLCLTNRFTVAGEHDPAQVFLRLRAGQPSHHSGYVRSGGVTVVTVTPERFLRVADGRASTSPIKGTRRRDADPALDAALAAELLASPKERAENVMIVDLMRNDLARVGAPGTVRVDALLAVESYPSVHQLVSTVSVRLRADVTWGDLLDATFPAGSMTGAPKLSAMTILHTLERGPRGFFAGCIGWVGDDGDADVAMVIRSIVIRPHHAYVGVGGGITWGSVPAAEVEEVGIKARAPLAALGAALPPGW